MKRLGILVTSILIVAVIFAVPARSGSAPQSGFENIKVLTDMSDTDIRQEMQNWGMALGVECDHCHAPGGFASDANPKKDIARKMATMVKTINKDFLNGKLSCIICHRGSEVPKVSQ